MFPVARFTTVRRRDLDVDDEPDAPAAVLAAAGSFSLP
jgi:hypothetical protein